MILPSNSNFYIKFPGFFLTVSEILFLLLPVVNFFCFSRNRVSFQNKRIKILIIIFLCLVFFIEFFLKILLFNQSIIDSVNSIKIGLPLFSSMILLIQGIRSDIEKVWNIILIAISFSVFLSIISIFVSIPIYNDVEITGNILEFFEGRLFNSNASFGIIGLFLLYDNKNSWYARGNLVFLACCVSILSLFLTFTRTYLALFFITFLILYFSRFSIKKLIKSSLNILIIFLLSFVLYNKTEFIRNQIDKRIFSTIFDASELYTQTVDNNRDVIFDGVKERLSEGYWIIGLPYNKPIFIAKANYLRDELYFAKTDTSFINILLRFGILPLSLFVVILYYLSKFKLFIFNYTLIVFLIASLNIDTLFSHNAIFFLIIIFFVSLKINLSNKNRQNLNYSI